MGHILTIDSDEVATLAARLTEMTGEGVASLVAAALRDRLETEQRRREWVAAMMVATDEFANLLDHPPPGSDHSWLYDDETGLPI